MKYDAFISYRHTPLDMEVAKKLHKALETYHIPPAVQKRTGKKRINRVFRDQEELPIGSDLSDKINDALKEAEYLIVICSPNTPESDWVLKEIETFIELHDREHILAVMIDGEPSESFPTPLLTDDEGKSVEPLAADIRGKDARERNSKFKTEFLRLAAPIIGCTYDDLKQRHKERIIRRNITIGAIAAVAIAVFGAVFGAYNSYTASRMKKLAEEKENLANEKTRLADEILEEYRLKQINQSRFLAEKSRTLFRQGYREDAILVAMEALPNKETDRPVVSEAEYALSEALYAYDPGYTFGFDRSLSHDCALNKTFLSDDESKIISIDQNRNTYIWDIKSRTLLIEIPPVDLDSDTSRSIYTVDANDENIFVQYTDCLVKYDYDGNILSSFGNSGEFYVYADYDFTKKQGILVEKRLVYIINLETMKPVKTIENPSENDFTSQASYSPDKESFFVRYSGDFDDSKGFFIASPETGSTKEVYPKDACIMDIIYTAKGNYALLCCNPDHIGGGLEKIFIDLYSADGTFLWSKDLSADIVSAYNINFKMDSHFYSKDSDNSEIVLAFQFQTFSIDEDTSEIRSSFFLPSLISGMFLYPDSDFGYFSTIDGDIEYTDLSVGMVYSEYSIQTDTTIRDFYASTKENAFLFLPYSSTEIYVMSRHPCKNAKTLTTLQKSSVPVGVAPTGNYFVMRDVTAYNVFDFYDGDGKLIYSNESGDGVSYTAFAQDIFYAASWSQIEIINPISKETTVLPFSEFGIDASYGITGLSFSSNGNYCVVYSHNLIYAIDLTERKMYYSQETDGDNNSVGGSAISSDGKKIIFNTTKGDEFSILDTESGTINTIPYLPSSAYNSSRFFSFSDNGNYFALCCKDGYLRLFRSSDCTVLSEIPFGLSLNFCFGFTADSSKLFYQRDDYSVSFYDIESNTYVNNFSTDYSIIYTIYDEANQMMAFYDGYDIYLISTDDFGVLAYVKNGFVYNKNDQTFITCDNRTLVKMPYRNYFGLIIEAKEEFPDSVLSEEKKVKYNIE